LLTILKSWYKSYFSNEDAVILLLFIITLFLFVIFMGHVLAPVLASLVVAYLLSWMADYLQKIGLPGNLSKLIIYVLFIGLFLVACLGLVPLLWQQTRKLLNDLPDMASRAQHLLDVLPEKFPDFFTQAQVSEVSVFIVNAVKEAIKTVISASLSWIPNLLTTAVYIVLVPLLVFFFLKDRDQLVQWFTNYLPKERRLINQVLLEVDDQIGNYIRGKVAEIILVGLCTYLGFLWFKLQYAALLAAFVGLSVLVPYVGAVVVTIPVLLVGYFQWGLTPVFWQMLGVYAVIQGLDANILVPLLFSEAVNLHPVAIIIAVLVFGGFLGFWGAFFAIPLATLVKAVMTAWPKGPVE